MKNIKYLALLAILILAACKKEINIDADEIASITVSNNVIGGRNVKLNTNLRDSAVINNYRLFSIGAKPSAQVKLSPSNNPSYSYFSQSVALNNGDIYSVFLTGTAAAPEGVLVKDAILPFAKEEIIRVRVANMSPGSGPVNVTLSSATGTHVFSGVGYKQVTEFKSLPLPLAGMVAGSNVFQVRDATNTVKTSYTLPGGGAVSIASSRYKNITLVIKGVVGGTDADAYGILAVANY